MGNGRNKKMMVFSFQVTYVTLVYLYYNRAWSVVAPLVKLCIWYVLLAVIAKYFDGQVLPENWPFFHGQDYYYFLLKQTKLLFSSIQSHFTNANAQVACMCVQAMKHIAL